jgi:release factor glutamine methyltransferase
MKYNISQSPTILTANDLLLRIRADLQEQYEPREAENIAYILLEKMYGLKRWECWENINFSAQDAQDLGIYLQRLQVGEPLQYVLEEADFYGLRLKVTSSVLIPRPETEELVDWILEQQPTNLLEMPLRILDIGTGSGAIAIALAKSLPQADVWAIDVSPQAVQVARQNAAIAGVKVYCQVANILTAQAKDFPKFDIVVSNPPYIPQQEREEMPKCVTEHEPALALFVPNDEPLLFYKKIATFEVLKPNGTLYFEIHEKRAEQVKQLLTRIGYQNIQLKNDMQQKARMIAATRN